MFKSRLSKEYFDRVNDFLNFAFEKSSQDEKYYVHIHVVSILIGIHVRSLRNPWHVTGFF